MQPTQKRRAMAALLSAVMLCTALPVPAQAAGLRDIAGHWARLQIEAAVAEGYVNGFPDGSFRPDQPVTRAEFFKMLGVALQLSPQPSLGLPFVEKQNWAMLGGYIQAAVSGGLLQPSDYGTWFGPEVSIQRREMVLAAVRAIGMTAQVGKRALNAPDAASYPDWLQSWTAVAVSEGIIKGLGDGTLGLDRTATRAEALVVIQRILQRVTMRLAVSEQAAAPNSVRHPAAGEPLWTMTDPSETRPTFSDGQNSYQVDRDLVGYVLMPAPGKAAWAALLPTADEVLLWHLQGGQRIEVGRFEPAMIPLAIDDGGRFWFSQGDDLLVADAAGQVATIAIGEPLLAADMDGQGNLLVAGTSGVYRVSPSGVVVRIASDLPGQAGVRYLAAGEDGAVWLFLSGATGARLEAVRLQEGKVTQRTTILSAQFGGEGRKVQAAVLGRSGPVRFLIVRAEGGTAAEAQESIIRFDMEDGSSTRLITPRWVGQGSSLAPAPDGSALLRDAGGKFWRILP